MTEQRAAIVAEARSWIGTPWVHQHREKATGVDCAGLVTRTGKNLGLTTFDVLDYDRLPAGGELLRLCDEHLVRIAVRFMQPGDVAAFRIRKEPQHLAIVADYPLGGLSMIHGDSLVSRSVVEHRMDDRWMARVVGAWRFPGVAE